MTTYSLFPGAAPSVTTYDKGQSVNVGTSFYVTTSAWATQISYLSGNGMDYDTSARTGAIWVLDALGNSQGVAAGPFTLPAPTAQDQWVTFDLPVPLALAAGQMYRVAILHPNGGYPATPHYFWSAGGDRVFGPVTVPSAGAVPNAMQGTFKYTPYANDIPDSTYNEASYYSNVTVSDILPGTEPVTTLKRRESGAWVAHSGVLRASVGGQWVPGTPKRWDGSSWSAL